MVREYSSNMPKFDKYGCTIIPKDSPYLDARQAEGSDDGEEINAKAIRDLPAYLAEGRANYSKPAENAVAALISQPSSSEAQLLNKEKFDYSLLIFKVPSKAALVQHSSRPPQEYPAFKFIEELVK
jgi:hypothetical protein